MKKNKAIKTTIPVLLLLSIFMQGTLQAQMLRLPESQVNYKCQTARKLGATDIAVTWNAPGVKGREGKIWGTDIAPYGFTVLGFGSSLPSPWRAGADESTTISFSTDVTINGKPLPAGKYGFFIAVYPDSCTLIFNKNHAGWGSYFYKSDMDVLRVTAYQQKNAAALKERLEYTFSNQTERSVDLALEWEKWRIPFTVGVDLVNTTLAYIRTQMSGAAGFDPPSLESAAAWCLRNQVNTEEALAWINSAVDPNLGGVKTFSVLSVKAGLLNKLDRKAEAAAIMKAAMENASVNELHNYGRRLLTENKVNEAMEVFELNHKRSNGAWPTNAGLMRGYSAKGDLKKALEYANKAVEQAPSPELKKILQQAAETLSKGKAL
ncbi:MAG: DUF2911 domain-containing protein [Chitinophagaceae bacterium]|nr:DUF2911 domain-containing protein [Chitinophagaceae bacterium]